VPTIVAAAYVSISAQIPAPLLLHLTEGIHVKVRSPHPEIGFGRHDLRTEPTLLTEPLDLVQTSSSEDATEGDARAITMDDLTP
jgi:hypothetical protein